MASTTREQPPWTAPRRHPGTTLPPLKIYNSLTRRKDDFIPVDPAGKVVTWYTCGPTVYNDAHLGHAKNYVSTDILRRIMKDYFGFKVKYTMNITDIDDKIILRGRQSYLLAKFKEEQGGGKSPTEEIVKTTHKALNWYITEHLSALSADTRLQQFNAELAKFYGEDGATAATPVPADPKLKIHIENAKNAAQALSKPGDNLSKFYELTEEVLLPYLDFVHGKDIDSSNHEIFTSLTKEYENRFFEDMRALNVQDPDVLVRVTEYVPQIVKFTEKIVENGFAYATSDGSVYFDVDSFEKAGHHYCRLEPWSRNDKALQADGEGSLSKGQNKRSDSHFALWKASKPGEPAWPSPWGPGRPGWHIECSVMASEVFGKTMDIHSGGVDLRFPHHDNELAQSEAYWSTPECKVQWANYFTHAGHLSIQGMKMSKSLKNFTTVRTALSDGEWTARSVRICFLLGAWQDGIEITEELLKGTAAWEAKINNFFLKSVDVARNAHKAGSASSEGGGASEADTQLLQSLEKAKVNLDAALCDSFNTPAAMRILADLVTEFNSAKDLRDETVLSVARWITKMVTIFGLDAEGDLGNPDRAGWSGTVIAESAAPYIYPASQLRDKIRQLARSAPLDYPELEKAAEEVAAPEPPETTVPASNPYRQVLRGFQTDVKRLAAEKAPTKDLLALCDRLRDTHLWNLGIYLEDREWPAPAMVRPVDKSLLEARAERESAAEKAAKAKAERLAREAEKQRALQEKAKMSHSEMYRTEEYAAWDADGVPTVEKGGLEVSKNKRKKLVKEWEKQKELHEKWLASK